MAAQTLTFASFYNDAVVVSLVYDDVTGRVSSFSCNNQTNGIVRLTVTASDNNGFTQTFQKGIATRNYPPGQSPLKLVPLGDGSGDLIFDFTFEVTGPPSSQVFAANANR